MQVAVLCPELVLGQWSISLKCRRNRHADQGQVLYWFLFRFHGADDVVDVRDGKEAKHWRWMSFAAVLAGVTGFRRPMYQRLSQEFNEHL